MIKGIRHIGIVVSDLDRALTFYRDLLGLSFWKRAIEEGEYIANVVRIPGVKVEWVKLGSDDGFIVELLQYRSHPDSDAVKNIPSNRIGCSHVAFTTSDINEFYDRLVRKNIHCNSSPQLSPDGKCKVLYCHDLDGTIIEIVEELL